MRGSQLRGQRPSIYHELPPAPLPPRPNRLRSCARLPALRCSRQRCRQRAHRFCALLWHRRRACSRGRQRLLRPARSSNALLASRRARKHDVLSIGPVLQLRRGLARSATLCHHSWQRSRADDVEAMILGLPLLRLLGELAAQAQPG